MRMLIVSGFLGAGKTTILMELLHAITDSAQGDRLTKVVVIENEVGDVSIDDRLLGSIGMEVRNIFSGCVCCTLSGELMPAIHDIREHLDPEWIVLETTGVAVPSAIVDTVEKYLHVPCKTLVIVDASRWQRIRLALAPVLEGQLAGADIVLVNKCDLLKDIVTLDEIESDILALEPTAHIYRTSKDTSLTATIIEDILS